MKNMPFGQMVFACGPGLKRSLRRLIGTGVVSSMILLFYF
jgi:hypothetical protein